MQSSYTIIHGKDRLCFSFLISVTLISICIVYSKFDNGCSRKPTLNLTHQLPSGKLSFFVLGDTGSIVWPAKTRIAKLLIKYGSRFNTSFNIMTGDNIYYFGVIDEHDSRFYRKFEVTYQNDSKNYYMIAGNHDYFGNVTGQIEYTKKGTNWKFPSEYYLLHGSHDGVSLDILMIDTMILCGNTKNVSYVKDVVDMNSKYPVNIDPDHPSNETAAQIQWSWIEDTLRRSTATHRIVVGHYPLYTVDKRMSNDCLIARLEPLLLKYNVATYYAGHSHNLQHIHHRGVDYFVSGAGCMTEMDTSYAHLVPEGALRFKYPAQDAHKSFDDGGFMHVEVTKNEIVTVLYDSYGTQLYRTVTKSVNK